MRSHKNLIFLGLIFLVFAGDQNKVNMQIMPGQALIETTYTGAVMVKNVDPAGTYIALENTSRGTSSRDVNLDGYSLSKKDMDTGSKLTYHFENFTLKAGMSVKIWAKLSLPNPELNDLIFGDSFSWGFSRNSITSLVNDRGEVKATYTLKSY